MRIISEYFRCTFRPKAAGYPAVNARWPPRNDDVSALAIPFELSSTSPPSAPSRSRCLIESRIASGHVHCYDKRPKPTFGSRAAESVLQDIRGTAFPLAPGSYKPPAAPVVLRERAVPRVI